MHSKYVYLFLVIIYITTSCASKKGDIVQTNKEPKTQIEKTYTAKSLIRENNLAKTNFISLAAVLDIYIENEKSSQTIPATIRIKPQEVIWISAPLGMAKIMFTKDEINYYNKLNSTAYKGNYSFLEEKIGLKLSFNELENLLMGNLIFSDKNYELDRENKNILVGEEKNIKIINEINSIYKVGSVKVIDREKDLDFEANYTYQSVKEKIFPNEIAIRVGTTNYMNIKIGFSNIKLDKNLNFPFKTPEGYKEIN